MPEQWEAFVDHLKDSAGLLAKEELKRLITDAKGDSSQFIQKQGMKLERYLNQLAAAEITKEAFEGYVEDLRALTEMQSLKMRVAAKASAQRFCKGIEETIFNGLLELL